MSMNEYQRVVCFALSRTSIAVAGFTSMVCKLQSRFTKMRNKFMLRLRSVERRSETIINSTYCRFLCFISLSNHIRFRLLGSRLLFSICRPIGPVHHHRSRSIS